MAEGGRSGDQRADGGDPDGDPSLTEAVVDAGLEPAESFCAAIAVATGGNPLFVRALLDTSAQEGLEPTGALSNLLGFLACVRLRLGRLLDAEADLREGLELSRAAAAAATAFQWHAGTLAELLIERGEVQQAGALIESARLDEQPTDNMQLSSFVPRAGGCIFSRTNRNGRSPISRRSLMWPGPAGPSAPCGSR